MRIVMRSSGGNTEWQVLESLQFSAEAELQQLLVESPSLIPIQEIREEASPLIVSVAELGLPGSGNTDILALSADGDIALIECKLAANPESKRKVIGQMFEYAAYLWGMSYEQLDQRVRAKRGQSLADAVADAVEDDDWDEEEFRHAVSGALSDGIFTLVIAVDEINEELSRTIRYLNSCTSAAFSLCALATSLFKPGDVEILVPHLYGPTTQPKSAKRSAREPYPLLEEIERLWRRGGHKLHARAWRQYVQFFSDGRKNVHFEILLSKDHVRLALHFESSDKEFNRKAAEAVLVHREEIETSLGEPLESGRGRKWTQVLIRRHYDRNDRSQARDAVADMTKFIDAVLPHLQEALRQLEAPT